MSLFLYLLFCLTNTLSFYNFSLILGNEGCIGTVGCHGLQTYLVTELLFLFLHHLPGPVLVTFISQPFLFLLIYLERPISFFHSPALKSFRVSDRILDVCSRLLQISEKLWKLSKRGRGMRETEREWKNNIFISSHFRRSYHQIKICVKFWILLISPDFINPDFQF